MPKGGNHGVAATSWWGATVPSTGPVGTSTTWVGVKFRMNHAGRICGARYYESSGMVGAMNHFRIWEDTLGTSYLRSGVQTSNAIFAAKWNQIWFRPWLRVAAGDTFRIGFLFRGGGYYRNNNVLTNTAPGVIHNNIGFICGWQSTNVDPAAVSITDNLNANAVDILFATDP